MLDTFDFSEGSTPALDAVMVCISTPVKKNKNFRDAFQKVLDIEEHICRSVFKAYVLSSYQHPNNKQFGFKTFNNILEDEGYEFPCFEPAFQNDNYPAIIPWEIFSTYWNLARDDGKYWQPNSEGQYNGLLSFEDFLTKWRKRDEEEIGEPLSQELK